MLGTPYICALYVATAGQQGNVLGSDEEEVVLLIYVVFDMTRNKIIGVQQYIVKPTTVEAEENVLSEQVTTETKLTEDLVRNLGIPLEVAVKQFDGYVRSLQIDPCSPLFRFVTDGQLPLRQCLHPEACSKNIDLPEYYNVFHDLRKDFRTFYNVPTDQELSSITHLVKHLRMTRDVDHQFYASEMKDMINIIQRLISDGHCFSTPETILIKLEPGICWKDEEVDNNCVVRARGLPWQSSDQDIAKFFRGLNVVKGGVALCLSAQGRRNGEALVRFVNQEHRDMALKRHKHHIGNRYIEVYKANGDDFVNVAGGSSNEAQAFLTKGAQVIIRMRGLPYDCTAKQVLEFFESGNEDQSCKVMDGEDGVLFVKKLDGRATGDAFVLFANEEDSPKALSKHRELIGTRYIELFRSTTAEVQQVLNRSMDPKTYEQPALPLPPPAHLGSFQYLPQHIITSGTRKDCIRLRGLPYEAMVEHILEFLGEHAKNIAFQGVHMVYNAQGQPSGEAFIQMNSEQSAFAAAQMRHHHYMYFGKKQRYIEVFQCSGEDMNLVLTGGIPTATAATTSSVSPIKTLISPGMLNTTTLLPANPNNPTFAGTTSAIPTTALLPPQSAAATAATAASPIAWDPISALQMQQVLAQAQAQAQAIRTQESVWLINHLAAQQQMQQMHQIQLAALTAAAATKQFQWTAADLNGTSGASAGTSVLPALPPPPSVTPISSIVNTSTTVSTPSTAAAAPKSKVTSFSPTVYPGTTPIHIPQSSLSAAAAAAAASSSQPLLLINIPRITPVSQHQQMATNKIGCSSSSPTPAGTATISLSSSAADPLAQYNAASLLNLKRSWEQAFPAGMVSAQAPLKRQTMVPYSLSSLSTIPTNSAIFTVPPPQLPSPSTAVQQQPTVGFRTAAQYYTGA